MLDETLSSDSESPGKVEIVITEDDLLRAANTYVAWNQELITISQEDLDLTPEANRRFYDRLRRDVREWAKCKGVGQRYLEYILLAPDLFLLLVRLIADDRVPVKWRTVLLGALAYFVFPLDAMPEGLIGPVGYVDDVVLAALAILGALTQIDETIVREHWSGEGDIVAVLNKVRAASEALVGAGLLKGLKAKANYVEQ